MGDVVDINSTLPHFVCRCVCLVCRKRWISVVPVGTDLTRLECPGCGETEGIGLVVVDEREAE